MCIREKEEELFREWRRIRNRFVPDGLADEAAYKTSIHRIVFVLKETNGFDDGDLRELLLKGDRAPTWTNVARWIKGICSLPEELPWSALVDVTTEQRRSMLRAVGAMNLKKSTGGHTTNNADMWSVAHDDADLLKSQYDLYDPTLTICCGSVTAAAFRKFVLRGPTPDIRQTQRGITYYFRSPGHIVVEFAHPEARVQDSLLYYGLVDAVKEILYTRSSGPAI